MTDINTLFFYAILICVGFGAIALLELREDIREIRSELKYGKRKK